MAVEPSAKRARMLDTAVADMKCNHRGDDVTETQVPLTEACKANTANVVRVRAVKLGDGIETRSACSSKSGWVSVDSSEVVLPPRQGCRLQISHKGKRKCQVWYPRNKGDVHESHSVTGQENNLQECVDWAWKRHEAAWVSLSHICVHSYIVYMKKALHTYIHKCIITLFWACLCNVFDLFFRFLWLSWISYIHTRGLSLCPVVSCKLKFWVRCLGGVLQWQCRTAYIHTYLHAHTCTYIHT